MGTEHRQKNYQGTPTKVTIQSKEVNPKTTSNFSFVRQLRHVGSKKTFVRITSHNGEVHENELIVRNQTFPN